MGRERRVEFFDGVDFAGFWKEHPYYTEHYQEAAPSDELIAELEA